MPEYPKDVVDEMMEIILDSKVTAKFQMYPKARKKLEEICRDKGWKDGELLSVLVLKEYNRIYKKDK